MDSRSMLRLASKALSSGGERTSPKRVEWNISGNCTDPVGRDLTLKAVQEKRVFRDWQSQAAWRRQSGVVRLVKAPRDKTLPLGYVVGLTVRCRRCQKCRRMRRMLWSERATNEIRSSFRTWFGTLTLSPENQYKYLCIARERLNKQGIDYDMLDYGEQFRLKVAAIGLDVTKYLKRVRKESQAPLRFLWVCEVHKSGDPHFHVLVHEHTDRCVCYATLSGQWGLGFTKWNLVKDLRQGTYLTKYLSKSTAARVRASVGYGKTSLDLGQLMSIGRDFTMNNADPNKTLPSPFPNQWEQEDQVYLDIQKEMSADGLSSSRVSDDAGPKYTEWLSRLGVET